MKIARLLLLTFGIMSAGSATAQEAVRMIIKKNLPLVEGQLNGVKAYFIIDTGASITVLNADLARKYKFTVVHNDLLDRYHITGLGGDCAILEVRHAQLQINSTKLDFINRACAIDRISMKFAPEIRIAGIIGTDVLAFLGSQINFADSTLVIHSKGN